MSNNSPISAAVAAAIQSGNPIEAIKRVREETGLGLQEARALVDAHVAGRAMPSPSAAAPASALPLQAILALRQGRRIDAIRAVREQRRIGLKDAKQIVDAYVDEHPELLAGLGAMRGTLWRKFLFAIIATALAIACYWRFAT